MTIASIIPILGQDVSETSIQWIEAFVMALVFLGVMRWVGKTVAKDSDRSWLPRILVWAYVAKVFGSLIRYWMVTVLYDSGDSFQYHAIGKVFAPIWRGFMVPVSTAGGAGTAFTEEAVGFVYAIYTPTFLGAFLLFATFSFVGQILFYAAFRPWLGEHKQKLYGLAVFFFPSLVFWPSSLGKDALMVFSLGLAAYGASRLLRTQTLSSGFIIAPGLFIAAGIRPHVAGTFALALVLALFFGKSPEELRGSFRKPVLIVVAVAGALVVLTAFSASFEVGISADRSSQDVGGFLEEVSERTATGGSQIDGAAVSSPAQLPGAVITVLFRPLIYEGANAQMIISALEGTALLLFVVVRMPQMWRNKGMLRRKAYLTFCFFYTGGFIIGFSAILNLGILARQRVQVLPMFLALLVALGWPEPPPVAAKTQDPDLESALAIQPRQTSRWVDSQIASGDEEREEDGANPGQD